MIITMDEAGMQSSFLTWTRCGAGCQTMWVFREGLKEHQLTEELFDRFHECLRALNVKLKSGQTVDATFSRFRYSATTGKRTQVALDIDIGDQTYQAYSTCS